MSTLEVGARKSLMLFSGRAFPELAEEIATAMGVAVTSTTAREFANGETFIKPDESVRGSDSFVIQSYTQPINQWVMESLILVDALKRASAKRITLVAPFYPYARQDKKHRGREPISARLWPTCSTPPGPTGIMSIDLHTAQIQGFFDGPVDHLFALPLLARATCGTTTAAKTWSWSRPTPAGCASPSSGPTRSAALDIAFVHKTRSIDTANEVVANRVVGDVDGRCCLLIDDMIDTGGTIVKAADLLFERGDRRRDRGHARRSSRRRPPTGSRTAGSAK